MRHLIKKTQFSFFSVTFLPKTIKLGLCLSKLQLDKVSDISGHSVCLCSVRKNRHAKHLDQRSFTFENYCRDMQTHNGPVAVPGQLKSSVKQPSVA